MLSELAQRAPAEWARRPIESVCARVTSGGTPKRGNPEFYIDGKWPWVKTQELRDCWLDDTEEHITEEAIRLSSAKVLPARTVLLALYGATVGQLGVIRRAMTCNQACCAMVVNPNEADYRYLYFALLSSREQLKRLASGAAQQNLSGKLVRDFVLPFPHIETQQRIASVLGSLDDKIELNRRMNRTLERMAQALFKSWFIDFDPVRAKAEGRDPGLPPDLAALFPDRLIDSDLGPIPAGWKTGPMLELCSLTGGGTPKTSRPEYWDGDVLWASAKDVSQCGEAFLIATERSITRKGVAESSTKIIPPRTTVVVARGATTGRMTMIGASMAMNQTCYALRSKVEAHFFLYQCVQSRIGELVNAAHGSVFDTITTRTFEQSSVVLPPESVQKAFNLAVEPLFGRILIGLRESRTLTTLRDTLLPRLLSGEIEVRIAESLAASTGS